MVSNSRHGKWVRREFAAASWMWHGSVPGINGLWTGAAKHTLASKQTVMPGDSSGLCAAGPGHNDIPLFGLAMNMDPGNTFATISPLLSVLVYLG